MRFYFFFALSLFFISCSDSNKQSQENNVFRYNESSNISSLDPAFARTQAEIWITNQIFSGLVQLDDSLSIRPDVAKKWEISEDGKTYLFTLRNDIYFHKSEIFQDNTR